MLLQGCLQRSIRELYCVHSAITMEINKDRKLHRPHRRVATFVNVTSVPAPTAARICNLIPSVSTQSTCPLIHWYTDSFTFPHHSLIMATESRITSHLLSSPHKVNVHMPSPDSQNTDLGLILVSMWQIPFSVTLASSLLGRVGFVKNHHYCLPISGHCSRLTCYPEEGSGPWQRCCMATQEEPLDSDFMCNNPVDRGTDGGSCQTCSEQNKCLLLSRCSPHVP